MRGTSSSDALDVALWPGVDQYGNADSTTGLAAALAYAASFSSPPPLYLRAGTYLIDSALSLFSGATISGAGPGLTTIKQQATAAHCLTGTDVQRVSLRGLTLSGPGSGSGNGVNLVLSGNPSVPYLDFEDLTAISFGGDGIHISTPIVSAFRRVIAQSCGGNGFALFSGTGGTSCALEACYANGNTGDGFFLSGLFYSHLAGCAADSNGNGYVLSACQGVTLSGCGAEATTTDSVVMTGGKGNTLAGCWVKGNAHYGVHVTAAETAASIIGFTEASPGAATASIITDTGTGAVIVNPTLVTAASYAVGTAYVVISTGGTAH